MAWLIIAFIVFPVAGVLLLLPYPSFRTALGNRKRADGTQSRARTKRERKHAADFAAHILLVPIIVVAVVGTSLIVVHEVIAPIPFILEVMGAYEVGSEVWEDAIEHEEIGDVGAWYEERMGRLGVQPDTARELKETLAHNWMTLLALLVGGGGVFYVAVSKFFVGASVAYQRGVGARAEEYWVHDGDELADFERALSELIN